MNALRVSNAGRRDWVPFATVQSLSPLEAYHAAGFPEHAFKDGHGRSYGSGHGRVREAIPDGGLRQ